MSIPTRAAASIPTIQSAADKGDMYQVTMQDATILWIPKEENNKDCAQVLAWAQAENISL